MPLYIRWADDSQTAILVQAVGKWTWETFYEVIEEARRMIDAEGGSHKVHTILDWSKNASSIAVLCSNGSIPARVHSYSSALIQS
jgi:hypothetical protein